MTNHTYPRTWHESEAIRYVAEALRFQANLKELIRCNRAIAHARTHLSSIGLKSSKRTDRLWAIVCKADKAIQARTEKLLAEIA